MSPIVRVINNPIPLPGRFRMRDLAFLLANRGGLLNLGDRLLQDVLRSVLQTWGASSLLQYDPVDSHKNGRAARCLKLLSIHLTLLTVALRRLLGGNARATVFLPPGQSLPKTIAKLPRVTAQLVYLCLLKILGIRIVCLGRDFYARSVVNRLQEIVLSRLADYYALRDQAALRRAHEIGVRNAAWFPDLSWLSSLPRAPGRLPFSERSSVVLCFRDPLGLPGTDERFTASLLATILRLMDETQALGLEDFVFVCHDAADRVMMTTVQERCRSRYLLRCESGLLSPADIPRIYGNAALVLTNRLHAVLLGLQCGAVALAPIHATAQEKIQAQLFDIGLGDLVLEVDASPPSPGIVQSTLDRQSFVDAAVAAYREKAVTAARLGFATLFS